MNKLNTTFANNFPKIRLFYTKEIKGRYTLAWLVGGSNRANDGLSLKSWSTSSLADCGFQFRDGMRDAVGRASYFPDRKNPDYPWPKVPGMLTGLVACKGIAEFKRYFKW